MSDFKNNLAKYRKAANLTRKDVAERLNVTVAAVGFYETGRTEPKIDTLIQLAELLHVTVDNLIGYHSGSFHVFDDSPEHINMEKAKLKNMLQGLRAYVYDAIDTAYKAGKDKGKENARDTEIVELPHPCDGEAFSDVRITEQITKIMSEVGEVSDANARYQKYGSPECRRDVLLELQDVIVAATTAQYIMGAELDERQRITREVNESNARRDNGARFKK